MVRAWIPLDSRYKHFNPRSKVTGNEDDSWKEEQHTVDVENTWKELSATNHRKDGRRAVGSRNGYRAFEVPCNATVSADYCLDCMFKFKPRPMYPHIRFDFLFSNRNNPITTIQWGPVYNFQISLRIVPYRYPPGVSQSHTYRTPVKF